MRKILVEFTLLIFKKKFFFLILWMMLISASLGTLYFIRSSNIETSLSGVEHTEAAQAMKIVKDEFNTRVEYSSALVIEGKKIDSLKEDLLKEFPQIMKINNVGSQKEHKTTLLYLEYNPKYPFNKIQASTGSIREYLKGWSAKHNIKVLMTGNTSFYYDIEEAGKNDSARGEFFALIFSFFILVLNFGALVSAFFPLIIGLSTTLFSTAIVRISGVEIDAIAQILNSLVGLALAIDYSLFIVSRFREEIKAGKNTKDALVISMKYSGKTIFISALIMLFSISVLLFPDVSTSRTTVKSIIIALSMSLFNTIVFLPVFLIYGKELMDKPKFISNLIKRSDQYPFWKRFSTHVVSYPITYFIISVISLLALSLPVINIKIWEPAHALAPEHSESRIAYNILEKDGWGGELIPINVVIKSKKDSNVYSPEYISYVYELSNTIKKIEGVNSVQSMASLGDNMTKNDYLTYYTSTYGLNFLQPTVPLITQDNKISLANVYTKNVMNLEKTQKIVNKIREYAKNHKEYEVLVGGLSARSKDFTKELYGYIPQTIIVIFAGIYLLLFLHMDSVVLPLKAAIMNFLPILSSYGILTLVFQYGYFSNIFHTPVNGAVTTMVPAVLFCITFGLSMDYEVLILSRITENFENTGDVKTAVVEGIATSGSVITGAALILLGVFVPGIFSTSPVIKEMCIGISAAIFIDATIVRLLLVPSFMMLMGKWNWYNPFKKG